MKKYYLGVWSFVILMELSLLILMVIIPKSHKREIKDWFEEEATRCDQDKLHHCSAWRYLTTQQYNEMIVDGINKLDPKIKDSERIFEMGVGVGAAMRLISECGKNLELGGDDLAVGAVKKVKQLFPKHAKNFFIQNMVDRHQQIPDNYYDHVVSFGAFGMYLTKKQMIVAMRESVRIAKPGASMIFTHFIDPKGKRIGSIIDKVEKQFWYNNAAELGIENIQIHPMLHQDDRYQMSCRKKSV